MAGFDELWTHYQQSIQSSETPQKSAWVLLTVLFLVKYSPFSRRFLMLVIVRRMQGHWKNEHNDLMEL
jgi:hypothetical protein